MFSSNSFISKPGRSLKSSNIRECELCRYYSWIFSSNGFEYYFPNISFYISWMSSCFDTTIPSGFIFSEFEGFYYTVIMVLFPMIFLFYFPVIKLEFSSLVSIETYPSILSLRLRWPVRILCPATGFALRGDSFLHLFFNLLASDIIFQNRKRNVPYKFFNPLVHCNKLTLCKNHFICRSKNRTMM